MREVRNAIWFLLGFSLVLLLSAPAFSATAPTAEPTYRPAVARIQAGIDGFPWDSVPPGEHAQAVIVMMCKGQQSPWLAHSREEAQAVLDVWKGTLDAEGFARVLAQPGVLFAQQKIQIAVPFYERCHGEALLDAEPA